jgi:hypothetical protein
MSGHEERRQNPRYNDYQSEHFKIEPGYGGASRLGSGSWGGRIEARLIDISEGGLGVEVWVPLILDSFVNLSVELSRGEERMALEGQARVVHCFSGEDEQTYRVGLAFQNVSRRELSWSHD